MSITGTDVKMRLSQQYGLKKSLDHLFQFLFMSVNLFSSFESQNGLHFLKLNPEYLDKFSEPELQQLLSYFLDLVEYFTNEKIQMIQNPSDKTIFTLSGGF
ncbi:MAG: hypothetical protein ACTSPG_07050 [Candidatus Hodarchaeales archaeon]